MLSVFNSILHIHKAIMELICQSWIDTDALQTGKFRFGWLGTGFPEKEIKN
jgi:hypothetical protein